MPEFDPAAAYMQEGYWNPHSMQDECPVDHLKILSSWGMFGRMRENHRMESIAKRSLSDFVHLPSREMIRRFREGEFFDASQYPNGTIINFEEEQLALEHAVGTEVYGKHSFYLKNRKWGVVTQKKDGEFRVQGLGDYWVDFRTGRIGHWFIAHDPKFEIGKTDHSRTESPEWGHHESFDRVLDLSLWAIGKGSKKSVEEGRLSWLRRLNPQLGTR